MDMTNFKIDEKFDIITCYFDSFNHLPTKEMVLDSLQCCYDHLADGGLLLLDVFVYNRFQTYIWMYIYTINLSKLLVYDIFKF